MDELFKRQLLLNQIAIMEALLMESHYGEHIKILKETIRLSKTFIESPEMSDDDQ